MNRTKTKIILTATSALVLGFCLFAVSFFGEKTDLYVKGHLTFTPEMAARAAGKSVIFITLFDQNAASPMPYAAFKTHTSGVTVETKIPFILTKNNVQLMPAAMNSKTLPTQFRVKARLDADGLAGPDSPGDLTGEKLQVPFGTQNLELVIDKAITE